MQMNMTTDEKDVLLARVIEEHYSTQKNNPACVPVEHLNVKGFDISDIRNALWRLEERGAIKNFKHGWGFFELRDTGKKVFVMRTEEEPNDGGDDFEAYEIGVIPARLMQMAKTSSEVSKPSDMVVLHLTKEGDLYRDPKKNFCHEMRGDAIPLKILRYFIDNPNKDYELSTADVSAHLGMEPKRIRDEVGKMRRSVEYKLKLSVKLFESRPGSGYRLNPKVEILLED